MVPFSVRCKLIDNNLIIGITIHAYVVGNVICVIQFCNLRVFIEIIIIVVMYLFLSASCRLYVCLCVCGVTASLL